MEPLEAAADEVDDFLLNFSEDLFLDPNMSSSPSLFQDTQRQQQHTENQVGPAEQLGQQLQTAEQQQHGEPARRLLPHEDPFLANFPPVEGELDWLTRGSGFQSFSFIPVTGPTTAASKPHKKQQDPEVVASSEPKRPSPVSVLEAASGNWPVRKRSKARQRIRTNLSVFPVDQQLLLPAEATSGGGSAVTRRSCSHCKVEETPQWRAGPEGPKTLCNACGVRYKSGRLVPEYRPANSPTFSSAVHSNSHRKIIEMRRNKSGSPPLLQPSLLGPAGSSAAPPAVMNIRKKKKRKKKEEEDAVHRMVVTSFAV